MNTLIMTRPAKLSRFASLWAALLTLSAHAGIHTFNFDDSGPIPQGGAVFSAEQTITGIEHMIASVELILTFSDRASLTGDTFGIQGLLNLGTDANARFVSFEPVVTSTTTHGERIFDVRFSGAPGTPA